jgi:imidazolonepropionase-like amidohydrolase
MYALTLLLALAQRPDSLAASVRQYVTVDTSLLALTHVLLVDGTGGAPKADQTIVIRAGKIALVGPSAAVQIPAGARTMDMSGSTVIPGLIGMHDHLFYTAAGGRAVQMSYTGPRLYLGSGVTTIRTTGSRSAYAEINLKDAIDHGFTPGPRIHITAPYITGAQGGGAMAIVASPDAARRFVAYWGAEGATWIKAYTDIRRSELGAAIQEAHKRGMKVTGHLCSVSFQEAVALGIDNLEHGMLTASDFDAGKTADSCPMTLMTSVAQADPRGSVAQATIRSLVQNKVSMTSTMAVYEPFVANRPTKDERVLQAMDPEVRAVYMRTRQQIDSSGSGFVSLQAFKSAMAFDRAFVEAGGLLGAGVDPTGIGGALAGFGDQRNYELFIEAGFTPAQAVQIMSANGAKILGVADRLGTIEPGKLADLTIVEGDLYAMPPADLFKAKVLYTVVGGEVVYAGTH